MNTYLLVINNGTISEEPCPPSGGNAGWSGKDQSPHDGFIFWVDYSEKDYLEMHQIYVRESDRQKGNGKKLMLALEDIAREKKVKYIYIASTAVREQPFGAFLYDLKYERVHDPFYDHMIIN